MERTEASRAPTYQWGFHWGLQYIGNGGNIAASVVVRDVDGDGRPDFVFTDSGGNSVHVLVSGTAPLACR